MRLLYQEFYMQEGGVKRQNTIQDITIFVFFVKNALSIQKKTKIPFESSFKM